jgi:hypothetical protein
VRHYMQEIGGKYPGAVVCGPTGTPETFRLPTANNHVLAVLKNLVGSVHAD